MTRRTLFVMVGLSIMVASSCIDPYDPPEIESSGNFLVVDGLVDLGSDDASVVLIHSQALDEQGEPGRETNATVTIELIGGQAFTLAEIAAGEYAAAGVAINPGDQCQLRVRTAAGEEFVSEVVTSKIPPPIDSVSWTARPGKLDIEVNTHDVTGNTRYYRWKYVETVMYQSIHNSILIWDEELREVRSRRPDEQIFTCWRTTSSTNIDVFSTKGLAEDIVSRRVIRSFPSTAWDLRLKYSIIVHQYAIDENEFNFWTELRKNTENIGTIFDPQPTQVTGNMRAVHASDKKVLGFFSVSASTQKRIFIERQELPYRASEYDTGYPTCGFQTIDTLEIADYRNGNKRELLISPIYDGPSLKGYGTADHYCIDCRLAHGGTTVRPDFWE